MRRIWLASAAFGAALTLPVLAQDDIDAATGEAGGTFLENLLQDKLSGTGRSVTVTGFRGALSSQASLDELTIADADGVWLTLKGATLDWKRSALLSGRLEVSSLVADEIIVARKPIPGQQLPDTTASPFALPELPVSVDIGQIETARLDLGADILGQAASFTLDGSGHLEGGEGEAQIALTRIDGPEGMLSLTGSYANATRELALDLSLSEGAGGIATTLAGLPGAPALDLDISGTGPIDDYLANIALASDGQPRLTGTVTTAQESPEGALPRRNFAVDLSGDLTPLFLPEYRDFFGPEVSLIAAGKLFENGHLRLDTLDLQAQSLSLSGDLKLNANHWPERINLTGQLASPDGAPVLLPVAGEEMRVQAADIAFAYDVARGQGWGGSLSMAGFERGGTTLEAATLTGDGRLTPGGGDRIALVRGEVALSAEGLGLDDPALSQAVGTTLDGNLHFAKDAGGPLHFTGIDLGGEDYGLTGDLTLRSVPDSLDLMAEPDLRLDATDLSRFAALSGQDLSGAVRLAIRGEAALAGGAFDLTVQGGASDLGIGNAQIDPVLGGNSSLFIAASRDEAGTRLKRFRIVAPGLVAGAEAWLAVDGSTLSLRADLPDTALALPGLEGPATLTLDAAQTGALWDVTLAATGPGGADLSLTGAVLTDKTELLSASTRIDGAIADLAAFGPAFGRDLGGSLTLAGTASGTPDGAFEISATAQGQDLAAGLGSADRLFAGRSDVTLKASRDAEGIILVEAFDLATPELTAAIHGDTASGDPVVNASLTLRDLGVLVDGMNGSYTGTGQAVLRGDTWTIEASGSGPAGTGIEIAGDLASDMARADLDISGQAPLQLANGFIAPRRASGLLRFDLSLNGPLEIGALSGTLSAPEARLALPELRFALEPLSLTATLSGGQASIDMRATGNEGGTVTVTGPVRLSAPYTAGFDIRLNQFGLTDPALYETNVSGTLFIDGPLTGGAMIAGDLTLGKVELQVPDSGFSASGTLDGLTHVGEPAEVYTTRSRAGMIETETASGPAASYGLDVQVNAPNQIFLRGRGLDAEMGGSLRVTGTTDAIISEGGFQLIRGRLDLLGKRFTLSEGEATLEGNLVPSINLVAETETDDTAVFITISGRAAEPEVTFTSSPSLPDDEILARLIFGHGIDQISPVQALKLASAVATLMGKGGAGVIGNLRNSFGLDDLDVSSDESGALAVRAGRYLSDNIYTNVEIGGDGTAAVELNLSITPSLTARGSATSEGETGVGIYFEKDY